MSLGLALGGLWGIGWALTLALAAGRGGVLAAAGLLLVPWCMIGGAIASRIPTERCAELDRRQGLAMATAGIGVWAGTYLASQLMLTSSFDLLHEIAALFATAVASLALIPWALVSLRSPWAAQPMGHVAYVGLAAVGAVLAWVASTVTATIVGFGAVTVVVAIASGAAGAMALEGLLGERARQRAAETAMLAAGLLSLLAGIAALGLSPATRDAAHTGSSITHRMMVAMAGIMDGDGDGVAGGLGFSDCNDIDPGVYPGAAEIPGNGRDDNCAGGDGDAARTAALWSRTGPRGSEPTASPFKPDKYNILLITLDAVRADHLSLYGYDRPTSPSLDNLAKLSLVFEAAWSPSNFTSLSLFSLFTGLYPSAYLDGERILARPGMTLTEQLQAQGYATEAVVDLHPALPHIYAGFQRVDDTLGVRAAKAVRNRSTASTANELTELAASAAARLGSKSEPFFLWVHYSEPHAGYLHHAQFDFGDTEMDRYDGEIAFADHAMGRLLQQLHQRGRLADTLVVVTSDHGEAFGEHGVQTHGQSLFEEELHVPLVIYLPAPSGQGFHNGRFAPPVDLTDVAPTLLQAVGVAPKTPMHGESLLAPALTGAPLRTPEAFAETRLPYARLQALRRGEHKMVINHLVGTAWETNLANDPGEHQLTELGAESEEALNTFVDLHLTRPPRPVSR